MLKTFNRLEPRNEQNKCHCSMANAKYSTSKALMHAGSVH